MQTLRILRSTDQSPTPVSALAAELNAYWAQPTGPQMIVLPNNGEFRSGQLRELHALAETQQATAVVVPLEPDGEFAEDWQAFPTSIAVRIRPPETHAALVFRPPLMSHEPFADVTAPVWDLLIRLGDQSQPQVTMVPIATHLDTQRSHSALPSLVPDRPDRNSDWLLQHLTTGERLERPMIRSRDDATALRAGLLQMHDFLEESHQLSQSVQGAGRHAAGDYWHGIMHRREPDYSNAKYWFRRVGRHPVFDELAPEAAGILSACEDQSARHWESRLRTATGWDPFAFVDLCQLCREQDAEPLGEAARRIQWLEMRLLLRQTYRDACA